jgi:hypothetical protein
MFCACERCAVEVMRSEFELGAYWGWRSGHSAHRLRIYETLHVLTTGDVL